MKKMSINQMEILQAGDFWEGVCKTFYVATALGPALALVPIGAAVVAAGTIGCIVFYE